MSCHSKNRDHLKFKKQTAKYVGELIEAQVSERLNKEERLRYTSL